MAREMLFGWASHDLSTMVEEESLFGHNNGMLSTYVDFVQSPNFPVDYARAAADRKSALLIAWEPWDWYAPAGEQPTFAPRRIAAGSLDTWITNWLKEAQTYTSRIRLIVRFAPEMNDSSRPWANGVETKGYAPTTPAEYIAMWRRVYDIKQQVAPDVEFMWNPLNYGAGAHPFETYFPGINYVDSVGINGFNWSNKQYSDGTWQSNDDVFGFGDDPGTPINRLIELAQGKPWGLAEVASAPSELWEFQYGGPYYDAWGSWVFEWPENPPYEQYPEDWITQEGWTEMLIRRSWDKGASFFNLFHTIKETDWRLTDTARGQEVPTRAMQAGVGLAFGSPVPDISYENPEDYEEVYSRGSRYGQDLTAESVERMLKGGFEFDAFAGLGDLFTNIIKGVGYAIQGAVDFAIQVGGPIVQFVIDGVSNLLGAVVGFFSSFFTRKAPSKPLPEIFSPIKADLEAELLPFRDIVDESLEKAREGIRLNGLAAERIGELAGDIETANTEIETIQTSMDDKIGEQGTLTTKLNNAATQEQYNELNTLLWGKQGNINQWNSDLWTEQRRVNQLVSDVARQQVTLTNQQNEIDQAQNLAIEANKQSIKSLVNYVNRMHFAPEGVAAHNDHFWVYRNSNSTTVRAKSSWTGVAVIQYSESVTTSRNDSHSHTVSGISKTTLTAIPGVGGTRDVEISGNPEIMINYQINPGTSMDQTFTGTNRTLNDGVRTTVVSWTVPEDTTLTVAASLVWSNKTWLGTYQGYLTLGGNNIEASYNDSSAPVVGHGARRLSIASHTLTARAGQVLRFEAYASHSNSLNRQIRDIKMNVAWVKST